MPACSREYWARRPPLQGRCGMRRGPGRGGAHRVRSGAGTSTISFLLRRCRGGSNPWRCGTSRCRLRCARGFLWTHDSVSDDPQFAELASGLFKGVGKRSSARLAETIVVEIENLQLVAPRDGLEGDGERSGSRLADGVHAEVELPQPVHAGQRLCERRGTGVAELVAVEIEPLQHLAARAGLEGAGERGTSGRADGVETQVEHLQPVHAGQRSRERLRPGITHSSIAEVEHHHGTWQ
mmetsp:Transcript_18453/g.53904  ORF Transcript_18453/g.53904 Transcript_18453/m.53904 type:complete len:238 (+) Transcript_18453:682-1395(+)